MGKEILALVSKVNYLLSIIRLLLSEDGFIRFTRLCDDNVVNDMENDYEKISSSLPSRRHDSFSFNADLCLCLHTLGSISPSIYKLYS
ncbi:hypothetical protein XBKQ1_480007 [Xenorhabdus bovienii str. kraussei Quebec]|uniref:Uncharacterized protein n=1 Tax=Xenorhabdus bovienii str. kraussei Quebec TaxID=1398203 RepID=A0A077PAN1_XENBV|nr:hypothetical protein XBKQ1_480007 [Xenorhabdus bovienii str. kraussei Quebec]